MLCEGSRQPENSGRLHAHFSPQAEYLHISRSYSLIEEIQALETSFQERLHVARDRGFLLRDLNGFKTAFFGPAIDSSAGLILLDWLATELRLTERCSLQHAFVTEATDHRTLSIGSVVSCESPMPRRYRLFTTALFAWSRSRSAPPPSNRARLKDSKHHDLDPRAAPNLCVEFSADAKVILARQNVLFFAINAHSIGSPLIQAELRAISRLLRFNSHLLAPLVVIVMGDTGHHPFEMADALQLKALDVVWLLTKVASQEDMAKAYFWALNQVLDVWLACKL